MSAPDDTLPKLGRDGNIFRLDSAVDIQQHVVAMAEQTRRQLLIFSPNFTHRIYDSDELVEAISLNAFDNRFLRVQILVSDPRACIAKGHRLVDLAQRLSSYIEIRRTHARYQHLANDYLLADSTGCIFRINAERFAAEIDYNTPRVADNRAREFTTIWEASTREREFLSLNL